MGLSYNKNTAVGLPVETELYEDTTFLNQRNIVGRESDIQTEPFIHSFNTIGLATDNYTLLRPIILTNINIACNVYTCSLNISTNVISDGAVTNREITLPNWRLEPGEILISIVTAGGVHWIGYYAD